jgi:hypothetical protein
VEGERGVRFIFSHFVIFLLFIIFLLKGEWVAIGFFQKKIKLNSSRQEGNMNGNL